MVSYPGRRGSLNREEFDFALDPRRAGQPRVACEQDGVQRFGKRDVGGVVRAEVVAKLPDPRYERNVQGPLQPHPGKVGKSHLRAARRRPPSPNVAAQGRGDLEIDHRRSRKTLARQPLPKTVAEFVLVRQRRGDHRRIDDYHSRDSRASRSARMYSAASCGVSLPPPVR